MKELPLEFIPIYRDISAKMRLVASRDLNFIPIYRDFSEAARVGKVEGLDFSLYIGIFPIYTSHFCQY